MLFRTLNPEEIELRVGTATDKGVTLLLYKNARVDMAILDETFGPLNWQREHYEVKGNMFCRVGVWNEALKEWIWKADCGTESFTEAVKGESSDAFKRSCTCFGIGRELYTAPFIWIPIPNALDERGKLKKEWQRKISAFKVEKISTKDGEIKSLEIVDKDGMVVWKF